MTEEQDSLRFELPGPNDPRLNWDMTNWMVVDEWRHLVMRSAAEEAVQRLAKGGQLADADLIAFGRLNFHAHIDGFGPPVALWDNSPRFDPAIRAYYDAGQPEGQSDTAM